jgi:hypothetical protein
MSQNAILSAWQSCSHLSSFAIFAAVFAMTRKLLTDKTLRLHKSSPKQH